VQQRASTKLRLLDHVVGEPKQWDRENQAELVGSFHITVMAKLNLVVCSTGISAGFAPFRILPTYTPTNR
jgi:hypothetical protein